MNIEEQIIFFCEGDVFFVQECEDNGHVGGFVKVGGRM